MKREQPQQAIVFCRTKRGTDKVERRLSKRFDRRGLHSRRPGAKRSRSGDGRVSRGQDSRSWWPPTWWAAASTSPRISHIINYDIPQFCDDYVHRVGRTGRMGREGVAFTFVTPEEGSELTRIEMRIDRLLKRDEVPGFSSGPRPVAGPDVHAAPADGSVAVEEPAAKKPTPMLGRGGRPPRRIRRAL